MKVSQSQFGGITRRLIAIALGLWLGGAGCLLGCEISVSAATLDDASRVSAQTESCPLSVGSECCHHRAKENHDAGAVGTAQSSSSGSMMCCPLSGQATEQARKLPRVPDPGTVYKPVGIAFDGNSLARLAQPLKEFHVPDRGGTYLRCCVFLI